MTAYSSSGTTIGITAPGELPETSDVDGYATETYTTVGEVESLPGEIGATFTLVTFNPLAGTGIQKLKGTPDGGSTEFNVALDPEDTGQDALMTAAASKQKVAFKITLPDDLGIIYVSGLVMKATYVIGGPDDVAMMAVEAQFDNTLVFDDLVA